MKREDRHFNGERFTGIAIGSGAGGLIVKVGTLSGLGWFSSLCQLLSLILVIISILFVKKKRLIQKKHSAKSSLTNRFNPGTGDCEMSRPRVVVFKKKIIPGNQENPDVFVNPLHKTGKYALYTGDMEAVAVLVQSALLLSQETG
ncbi:hypothetical protein ACFO25_17000 [Paenactinomyces guangxiensis]|uniref:Uncharacterized protein n=1 Tax=Paenactinomyces guangxiensis TaxID=1490290 RepID=A0A7W1WUD2_9BACL|nr:hypothetical protein [Paenactinomyces guangxiensis]MBA4496224.1 hypothetical protein [Paenactinomyces guangxiensis]MBH8593313.1 hypothetical protein [Paenactinomyces guangxiensis]